MENKNLIAILQVERAKEMSRASGFEVAQSRYSTEARKARARIAEIDKTIEQARKTEVGEDEATTNLVKAMQVQAQLKSELRKQLSKGNTKQDRHLLAAYVANMLMIRNTPMKVNEIREQLSVDGYYLSNWSCFMRTVLKYNPSVVRIARGTYAYKN